MSLEPLPIDPHLPALTETLSTERALVLVAEPGAGKTTRLPPALLDHGDRAGQVLVLEPRRLAATLAARRVAFERGGRCGEEVGYQVRFDRRTSADTRLVYMTEGVLLNRLSQGADSELDDVSTVVCDEFHERHLQTDLVLTLLERLRRSRRPDLELVIMSATLDGGPVAEFLEAPSVELEGRLYPVEIDHPLRPDDRRLESRVRAAVEELCDDGVEGHLLVFLPGMAEIRRCERKLQSPARRRGFEIHRLHGSLSNEVTDAALAPSDTQKVILSTNIAESSVTIAGVEAVVDSGLARVAATSRSTGLKTLRLEPVSQASAIQRAHRAGREAPGRCRRLYTRNDFERRPARQRPEILRSELSSAMLSLLGAEVGPLESLCFLDPPPDVAWRQAEELLRRLGAMSEEGSLSPMGRRMLAHPLEPRLARTLEEGVERGVARQLAACCAILSEQDFLDYRQARKEAVETGRSDLLARLDLLEECRRVRFSRHPLRSMGVDKGSAHRVERVRKQLSRRLPNDRAPEDGEEQAILMALLAGHPDRVAQRQQSRGRDLVLSDGGAVRQAPSSIVHDAEWLVVLQAMDPSRPDRPAEARLLSAIEPLWLLELFPEAIVESETVEWDDERQRVEARWEMRYGNLVLESGEADGDPEEVRQVLEKAASDAGAETFCGEDELEQLELRTALLSCHFEDFPELGRDQAADVLAELCRHCRSFEELRRANLMAHLRARLSPVERRRLKQLAPEQVELSGGKRLRINYEPGQQPWAATRVQDFFGMEQGPHIAGGRVPLVLHLLAPNRHAISVTSDLAGFWERHYPRERRRLCRRYSKHFWPEDPVAATPPPPGRLR